MSAKEIERDNLIKQNAEYNIIYEEERRKLLNEIKVYNMLIIPELARISR